MIKEWVNRFLSEDYASDLADQERTQRDRGVDGDCYRAAIQYQKAHPSATVVQAVVHPLDGKLSSYFHAWAEDNVFVYDTWKGTTEKGDFYSKFRPDHVFKYTQTEVQVNILKSGHLGPWD